MNGASGSSLSAKYVNESRRRTPCGPLEGTKRMKSPTRGQQRAIRFKGEAELERGADESAGCHDEIGHLWSGRRLFSFRLCTSLNRIAHKGVLLRGSNRRDHL